MGRLQPPQKEERINLQRRVVITGLGAVTPLGLNVEEFWANVIAGKSGVGLITRFDTTDFNVKIAAEVKGFDPENYLDKKKLVELTGLSSLLLQLQRWQWTMLLLL